MPGAGGRGGWQVWVWVSGVRGGSEGWVTGVGVSVMGGADAPCWRGL